MPSLNNFLPANKKAGKQLRNIVNNAVYRLDSLRSKQEDEHWNNYSAAERKQLLKELWKLKTWLATGVFFHTDNFDVWCVQTVYGDFWGLDNELRYTREPMPPMTPKGEYRILQICGEIPVIFPDSFFGARP
jgi:hypothetical protein